MLLMIQPGLLSVKISMEVAVLGSGIYEMLKSALVGV